MIAWRLVAGFFEIFCLLSSLDDEGSDDKVMVEIGFHRLRVHPVGKDHSFCVDSFTWLA